MKKSILIVTPYFAPQTHAAVFRVHKLVKYLKRYGWHPVVLTVDNNYLYNEDIALLDELTGIPIYRARYVEPTFRGLRMALGGRDRTFNTLKKAGIFDTTEGNSGTDQAPWKSRLRKFIYTDLQERILSPVDPYWPWESKAIKLGQVLIKNFDISLIYTTCLPFTSNRIGYALKQASGTSWVADFRDPITYAARMHSTNTNIYLKQRKVQDVTFKYADAITTLSSAYELIFHDQNIGVGIDKVHFIPTGIDDDYLPQNSARKSKDIVFIGEYLREYDDYLLWCIKENIDLIREQELRIKFIGNLQINSRLLDPILKRLNIQDVVELIDHQPQRALYEILNNCWFVLIMSGHQTLWWCNYAKMVDYIGLRLHVLALVPELSEARKELSAAGLGLFAHSREDLSVSFGRVLKGDLNFPNENTEYCSRYLASNMTKKFIDIFERIHK